jgi:hypothetical protein
MLWVAARNAPLECPFLAPIRRSSGLRTANTSLRHLPPLVAPLAGEGRWGMLRVAARNAPLEPVKE